MNKITASVNKYTELLSFNGLIVPRTWEAKSRIRSCLSVRQSTRPSYQLMIVNLWSRNNLFELNVIFSAQIGTWIGRQVCCFTVLWLRICLNRSCTERSEIIFLLFLPIWKSNKIDNQSKQEIVFKYIIKNTNNRHEELM